MAVKYELDFEVGCIFDRSLKYYGNANNKVLCRIQMKSGRVAEYLPTITKYWGDTGQKSWKFEFIRYLD
jgi:hypothetical protein